MDDLISHLILITPMANNNSNDADVRTIIDGLARLKPPTLSQSVHREECTQCFDTQVRSISTATTSCVRLHPHPHSP